MNTVASMVEHIPAAMPMAVAVAAPQQDMLLVLIERALCNPEIQVDKLKAVLDMKIQWDAEQERKAEKAEAKQAEREFTAAMVEFKKLVPQILKDKHVEFKNKTGGSTSYDHATIGAVCDAIIPALATAGLSHSWEPKQHEGQLLEIICTLSHPGGHKKSVSMRSFADDSGTKNSLQAIRSAQTYMERYTLLDVCGVATGGMPDDDGRASGPIQGAQSAPETSPLTYDQTKFDANFARWSTLIESGRKTSADIIATVEAAAPLSDEQKKRINDVKPGSIQ